MSLFVPLNLAFKDCWTQFNLVALIGPVTALLPFPHIHAHVCKNSDYKVQQSGNEDYRSVLNYFYYWIISGYAGLDFCCFSGSRCDFVVEMIRWHTKVVLQSSCSLGADKTSRQTCRLVVAGSSDGVFSALVCLCVSSNMHKYTCLQVTTWTRLFEPALKGHIILT